MIGRAFCLALALSASFMAEAASPTPHSITPADVEQLAQRKAVVRFISDGASGRTTGVIDVDAPPAAVLAAVLDVQARIPEMDDLDAVETYALPGKPKSQGFGASLHTSTIGIETVTHVRYTIDLAHHWTRFELDPAKTNHIKNLDGWYLAVPEGNGSRLHYQSQAGLMNILPDMLRRRYVESSIPPQLAGIRDRAEQASK